MTSLDRQRPVRAALFDLDGTLADSAASIAVALNRLLAEIDRPALPVSAVADMVGDGAALLLERAFAASGDPVAGAAFEALLARYLVHLEATPPAPEAIFPGVPAALDRLTAAGWRLAVCTNKPEAATHAALRSLGLEGRFGAVIGGDTLPRRKPDPDPLLAALERLEVPAGRAVMVGDNRNDALAAQAAGLPVVLVTFGYSHHPLSSLGAAALIDRFADLPEQLDRLVRA